MSARNMENGILTKDENGVKREHGEALVVPKAMALETIGALTQRASKQLGVGKIVEIRRMVPNADEAIRGLVTFAWYTSESVSSKPVEEPEELKYMADSGAYLVKRIKTT